MFHTLQLEVAAQDLLAARTPLLPDVSRLAFVDVDSLLRRVYGPVNAGPVWVVSVPYGS